jgi:hypothetical protein
MVPRFRRYVGTTRCRIDVASASCLVGHDRAAGTLPAMGFNPFREQRKTAFDVAMVVGALALTIGLVLWAMFGG